MTLLTPVWLLLGLPLGVALYLWRPPRGLLVALRLGIVTLLLLALAGLSVLWETAAGTVIIVADRSLSMPTDSESAQKTAIELVQAAKGHDEKLAVVSFGQKAIVEPVLTEGKFSGFLTDVGRDASNLAEATELALSLIPQDAPGKILVLSDGRWTGRDPLAVAVQAAVRGVAIDYRPLERPQANDLAIARLEGPASISPGEGFMLTAWVSSPVAQEITYKLERDRVILAEGKRLVGAGLTRFAFRDRANGAGAQSYALAVTGAGQDPVPENNTARLLVGVTGARPLLLVSESDGLGKLLRSGGINLEIKRPEDCVWSLESLSRYSAALLENVPAEKIGQRGMELLAAWVRETGAGLMLTGGRQSFGPGGYFGSPLDPIMPVSMELRQEHRKLALAIVIALDRSGSMAVPVGGGRVKMDLANLGAAQVLDLLGAQDELGVYAVDTAAHVIKELGPATDKAALRSKILSIESMGGGIFVDVALEASMRMIAKAKSATKHIILFADANDAEQPGAYRDLLDRCKKAGITVSVIGLGKATDSDGPLLVDIAKRGGGRSLFTDRAEELPRLFAQDTFVVARSTFLDEPTRVQPTPGLTALAGKPFDPPPPIGGYNLCYLRPSANIAAVSVDEYKAPVVAAWQVGTGRTLCYTGECDGQYTGAIARWSEVGDFFTSLARWTQGPAGELPGQMLLTQQLEKGVAKVRLHLDPRRKSDTVTGLQSASTLRASPGQAPRADKAKLHWLDADTLALDVPLHGDEVALTTVEVAGHGPVSLPPVCLPYSPEFRAAEAGTGISTLQRLALATGGVERVELPTLWQEMQRQPRHISLARWLLLAAVVLLLLEVLERRTALVGAALGACGRRVPLRLPRRAVRPVPVAAPTVRPTEPSPSPGFSPAATPEPPPIKAPAAEAEGLADALRKARSQARGRSGSD